MTEQVGFLMKDLVLLAASFYLLKQDGLRAASARINTPTVRPVWALRNSRQDERAHKESKSARKTIASS
jgi:hypothetical protein